MTAGQRSRAIATLEQAVSEARARLGPHHIAVAHLLTRLARIHERCGNTLEALRCDAASLFVGERAAGDLDPDLLFHVRRVARGLVRQGAAADALTLASVVLGARRMVKGPDHADCRELARLVHELAMPRVA